MPHPLLKEKATAVTHHETLLGDVSRLLLKNCYLHLIHFFHLILPIPALAFSFIKFSFAIYIMKTLLKMLLRVWDWIEMFYGARNDYEAMREEDTGWTWRGRHLEEFERHERFRKHYRWYVEAHKGFTVPGGYVFPAHTEPLMSYEQWLISLTFYVPPWRGWYIEGLRQRRAWYKRESPKWV